MIRRASWGIGDQALSSLTNFVLVIMAARSLSRAEFGGFGIALAMVALSLGVSRAICSEPLVVCSSTATAEQTRREARAALGAATVLGFASALVLALFAVVVGGQVREAALPFALVLPAVIVQDSWRYVFVALRAPRSACANDTVWLVVQVAVLAFVTGSGSTLSSIVLAWGAGAVVSALLAAVQGGFLPSPRQARSWLTRYRAFWPRYAAEFLAASSGWQITLLALGAISGLGAVGALRGAQTLVGPLNVFFLAVPLVAVAEGARLWRERGIDPRRFARWTAAALMTVALAWGALIAALPESVGRVFLGESWTSSRDLLVPVVLMMTGVGCGLGALAGLRVLGAARASLAARLVVAPLIAVGTVAGALLAGASGAAWGWTVTSAIAAVVWWRTLCRAPVTGPPTSADLLAVPS